jgi:hypothetical protein
MKKQKITSYEFTLSQEEAMIFRRALVYLKHRIEKHNKDGGVASLERIEALLKEFNQCSS